MKILKTLKSISTLKLLDLNNNSVPFDEISYYIGSSNLSKLWLRKNDLRPHGIKFMKALSQSSMTAIDFNITNMTREMAHMLIHIIHNSPLLQELMLRQNNLGTGKIIRISQALKSASKIRNLNFGGNQVTEEATHALTSVISHSSKLQELYLSNNNLQAGAFEIMASVMISVIATFKVLSINSNNIPCTAVIKSPIFNEFINITNLDLSYNFLSVFLIESLSKINTLTSLNLNYCHLTNKVANPLTAAITSNHLLQFLYLSNNQLATNGVATVAQSIKLLSNLKEINIAGNTITENAADAVISVILGKSKVELLNLGNNKFCHNTVKIIKSLQCVSSIVSLYFHSMEMTEDMADDLVIAVNNNPFLEKLDLSCNMLSNSLIKVIKASKTCTKYLDLQCNCVKPSATLNLASVIGAISTLEVLLLGGSTMNTNEKIFYYVALNLDQVYHCNDSVPSLEEFGVVEALSFEIQRSNTYRLVKVYYNVDFSVLDYVGTLHFDLFNPNMLHKKQLF